MVTQVIVTTGTLWKIHVYVTCDVTAVMTIDESEAKSMSCLVVEPQVAECVYGKDSLNACLVNVITLQPLICHPSILECHPPELKNELT